MPSPSHQPFSRIAGRYQLLNSILSFGLDSFWRRTAITHLKLSSGCNVLDVGTGTGDMLTRIGDKSVRKYGIDPEINMFEAGRWIDGTSLIAGVSESLPFRSDSIDRITSAFAIRNFQDRSAAFIEFFRVMRSGAHGSALEMSRPANSLIGIPARWYIRWLVPIIGTLISGDRKAYKYLSYTVLHFPYPEVIVDELRTAGFTNIKGRRLIGGVTALYTFRKPD
jgi:demethylmenaquinone methyltransferase/2-methoxy-6-polyprenyl-1,4-benzoquinol methylase